MKLKKLLVYSFIIAFIMAFLMQILKVQAAPVQVRIGGIDRYDTAIKISQSNFLKSDYIVLVQGEDFADALSASPLAKKYNAPILLVKRAGLDTELLNEISRLSAKNIIIIGGTGVVSSGAEQQLVNLNLIVKRYAGSDRYETSAKVASEVGALNGAVIVSGENFPDALSMASIAAAKQMPILLVKAASIPISIESFLNNNLVSSFYVIGGTGVVYDSTISKLNNVKRISGKNRYETNLAVLTEFSGFLNLDSIYLASGEDYPDALAGSVVASLSNSPIIIVNDNDKGALNYVNSKFNSIKNIKIFGGAGAISNATFQEFLNPNLYTKKVLVFGTYYYYGSAETYNSLITNYKSIDELATDTFATDGNGNLIAEKGYNSFGNLVDLIPTNQISFANSKNIPVYAMITNGFNADTARSVLRNPTSVQNLISNTLNALRTYNYAGVNVDIEGIYASDRIYFSQFVQALSYALKPNNYTVTVAVPAKTYDSLTDGWSGGYDYNEIAKYADEIAIMTYDEHWSGGSPGPIASIDWVERVVKYSITSIPKNKILLGLASYGYDWPITGKAKAYTIDQAYNKANLMGANIIFDNLSKSLHYDYVDEGVQHSVWFENTDSISYKLDLVNSYDLRGIAIWSLSQSNSAYWNTINSKFNKSY